jgi:hypothetical protein
MRVAVGVPLGGQRLEVARLKSGTWLVIVWWYGRVRWPTKVVTQGWRGRIVAAWPEPCRRPRDREVRRGDGIR